MWVIGLLGSSPLLCLEIDDNGDFGWNANSSIVLSFKDKGSADAFARLLIEQGESVSLTGDNEEWRITRDGSSPKEYLEVDNNGMFEWTTAIASSVVCANQDTADKIGDFVATSLGANSSEQTV